MRWGAEHVASIIPLALAAAVYPALLAGIILVLARDEPVRMLAAFTAGGMLVTFVLGLLIVLVLGDALSTHSQNSASPVVDIVIGVLSLAGAALLHRRIRERERGVVRASKKKDGPSRTQKMLAEGTPWAAFAGGLILNLPGIWYLDALKEISRANLSTAAVIVNILVFMVIMFSLAELPLVGYLVAPEATQVRVARFQTGMSKHGRTIGMWAAVLIGAYLTIKGIINAV
jgi:Sap, sulfolipid-1-addressing protein